VTVDSEGFKTAGDQGNPGAGSIGFDCGTPARGQCRLYVVTVAQPSMLLEGIDWRQPCRTAPLSML
jgi:hypothetical protein